MVMRTRWRSLVPEGDSVEEHWCFVCETWIHCCTCKPEGEGNNNDDEDDE